MKNLDGKVAGIASALAQCGARVFVTGHLHRVRQGILLGCGYAENGGVYLLGCEPFRQPRILELGAAPTWVIDDINMNQR